uniref:Uncharacterized protein n=1 Tax=Romanomermis culicivorax TaxID=13658 RepID=A0A915L4W4_ROMCU
MIGPLLILFKGISSPLAGLAFINAVVFSVYGTSLKYFSSLYGDNIKSYFCAGCSAGLIQSLICSPMELAKLRLQLQGQGIWARHIFFYMDPPLPYSGPLDCLRKVYKLKGFRGIFRGLPLTVTRDGPCFGIYFASYEWLTRSMTPGGPETLTTVNLLFAGGAAGMISWLFLYPIDVVKSRFQADDKLEYKNSWHCAKTSYKTEGWRVFGHGLPSALLRAFPTNAVTFFTVEWIFRLANGYLLSSATNNSNNNSNDNNRRTKENKESSATSASEAKNYLFLPVPERNSQSPTSGGVGSSAMELTLFS